MSSVEKTVSVLLLKKLLYELDDIQSHTCVKVRLLGQRWQQSFMSVVNICDDGVLLYDHSNGAFLHISEVDDIIQFEIDQSFQIFEPHFHYYVVPE